MSLVADELVCLIGSCIVRRRENVKLMNAACRE